MSRHILDLLDRVGDTGITPRRLYKANGIEDHLEIDRAVVDAMDLSEPLLTHDQDGKIFLSTAGIAVRANNIEINLLRLGISRLLLPGTWISQHTKAGRVVFEHLPERYQNMLGLHKDGITVTQAGIFEHPHIRSNAINSPHVSLILDRRPRIFGGEYQICLRTREETLKKGSEALLPEYLAVAAILLDADLERLRQRMGENASIEVVVFENDNAFGSALASTIERKCGIPVVLTKSDDWGNNFYEEDSEIIPSLTFG